MIRAVMVSAIMAGWRLRPLGRGAMPAAIRRAVLMPLATVACAGCANPQAMKPAPMSDVACVRSVEAAGGSFLQAVAHCQQNPFNTLDPTMLDLAGAADLQSQAFESGYYNRDLPASNGAEIARLQSLHAGLTAAVAVRQKQQGKVVRRLSSEGCAEYLLGAPREAFVLGPGWVVGGPSPTNPYLTSQENYCVALQRAAISPANSPAPGLPPQGAAATESAANQDGGEQPPPASAAPSVKDDRQSAHKLSGLIL